MNPFKMMLVLLTCSLLLLNQHVISNAQSSRVDSLLMELEQGDDEIEKVKTLHQLMGSLVNNYPDSAMIFARKAFVMSASIDDPVLHGQSYMNLTHCHFVLGDLDSCRLTLWEALPLYNSSGQTDKEAAVYRNLAVIGEVQNEPDTSLFYLDKCIDVLKRAPDSNLMGDVYLSKGFAYNTKGFYNLAVEAYLQALRIFEANGSNNQKGYVCQNLGIVYELMGKNDLAIERSLEACDHFVSQENYRALSQTQNNLGAMFQNLGQAAKAKRLHRESILHADRTNQPDVITQNYWNLARIAMEAGDLDSAAYFLDQTWLYAEQMKSSFYLGGTLRYEAKIALASKLFTSATNYLNQSLEYLESYYDPQFTQEAYEDLAEIYTGLGDSENALHYTLQALEIKDSLYTLKKEHQIAELNLIYETEKKDAEIKLLETNAALDASRKKSLVIGLILLGLLGIVIIYTLIQRRSKDRKILLQEKEIEIEKRRNAEQDLEFKQKELMGKILQVARKNEFLLSLEKEMSEINPGSNGDQTKESRRLSRMIYRNTADDEDWDQFVTEFSSVHQDFMDKFLEHHGPLSKSEVRLITLLKMNLSSKDIADTLRISQEGIKKARYRLRKKLMLGSDIDIQSYILSFN